MVVPILGDSPAGLVGSLLPLYGGISLGDAQHPYAAVYADLIVSAGFTPTGSIIPAVDNTDTLGDATHRFSHTVTKDLRVSNGSTAGVQFRDSTNASYSTVLYQDASDNTVLSAALAKNVSLALNGSPLVTLTSANLHAVTDGAIDLGTTLLGFGSIYAALAKTLILKSGSNGKCGTFTANGTTPVTVGNTSVTAGSTVIITLKTVGGTVGAVPHVATITPSTGFTTVGTASDTSVYNYAIIETA